MKQWTQILLTILFPFYMAMILLTGISLTGFWTDVICTLLLSVLSVIVVFKSRMSRHWLTVAVKAVNGACVLLVLGFLGTRLADPFSWDIFKLRSFYFQPVDGRLFNAYFKPVGSYAGGYGNFRITETPRYFPLIEWTVFYDRTVQHDFNDDTFDGKPIDNYEVVRSYIREEVINKQK